MPEANGGPLPAWLAAHAEAPEYQWAVAAWSRATAIEGAWFDAAKADAVVSRWPTIFRLTDDRFFGVPFHLLPWQEITVRLLVGWKKPIEVLDPHIHRATVTHVRLYRRLDLWIPRKNGKSEFLAALGVLFFGLERVPRNQAYVFGSNEEQGKVPFDKMRVMFEQAAGLIEDQAGNRRIAFTAKSITVRETGAVCTLLTGEPIGKHGRSPGVIVGDEIHEWRTRELADTLTEGSGARLQPIALFASTAGNKQARVGYEWFEESMAVMAGAKDDPTTLVVWFGIGEEDDWTDEATWRKANPSLGLTPTLDFLRGKYREMRGRPVQEARFQCYYLNRWVDQVGGWLPKSRWDACAVGPEGAAGWRTAYDRLAGRRAYGACDVSSTRDLTCVLWLIEPEAPGGLWELSVRFWVPAATLDQRAQDDRRVDWRGWVTSGALATTPGDVVDQGWVEREIKDGFAHFDVVAFAYDPWNAGKLVVDLQKENEAGPPLDADRLREMRQGHRSLGAATAEFERLVFAARLDHGGHPVLAWMARNARVRFDVNLNYVPDKGSSKDKIDGIVSAVMATALAIGGEDQGLVTGADVGMVL